MCSPSVPYVCVYTYMYVYVCLDVYMFLRWSFPCLPPSLYNKQERRAALREQGNPEHAKRLDEDKTLFIEALERSLARLVTTPDEGALRRPGVCVCVCVYVCVCVRVCWVLLIAHACSSSEELTDREIMRLQRSG